MIKITEQRITTLAPNAAAVSNGKALSQNGHFLKLEKSKDETLYMGQCQGSGKNPYMTSVDFMDPENPVFRCSCPSRQFPCKHCVGLLFEMAAGKNFTEADVPEDILKKREKIQAKAEKAAAVPAEMTEEEKEKARQKAEKAKNAGNAARIKKAEKQLEGLELVRKLLEKLIGDGLGTMGGSNMSTYRDLSKQLGDYYLPGPQKLLNRLIFEITAFQNDQDETHYDEAIEIIKNLWNLTKKSKTYLQERVAGKDMSADANMLYEELGGIWKLTELEEAGCGIENGNYAQLAFYRGFDESANEITDYGIFMELGSGKIYVNKNIRPVKSLKYIKEEDSLFGVAMASRAAAYPGDGNQRIRWDGCETRNYEPEDFEKIRSFAKMSVSEAAKEAKNVLKNPLSDPIVLIPVAFSRIGKTAAGNIVLRDKSGEQLVLSDTIKNIASTKTLEYVPDGEVLRDQVMLLGFYENKGNRRIEAQPFSIITENRIVRLF